MRSFFSANRIWFEHGAFALVILLPLLLPGYILTLDLVFTPQVAFPSEVSNTYLLSLFLWLAHFVMPMDIIEKLILFLILVLSGVGMHKLIEILKVGAELKPYKTLGAYFGGVIYIVNPFTYDRFMAGQWMVLLGYSLLPFFVKKSFELLYHPNKKTATRLGIIAAIIAAVSIHHIGIMAVVGLICVAVGYGKYGHNLLFMQRYLVYALISLGIFLLLSSYWLIALFIGQSTTMQAISSFGPAQFQAFQTSGGHVLKAVGDVIRLQGFWAEPRQLFTLPQKVVPLWGMAIIPLWALIGYGAIKAWRHYRMIVMIAVLCIVIGIFLSATPLLWWLADKIPFVAGYREPQKFVNLIVIGFGLLGALGVMYGLRTIEKRYKGRGTQAASILVLVLPLAITPTMFGGFAGQLQPRFYPQEWKAIDTHLTKTYPNETALFLPWHQYANYSFSGRIIANPAEKFFQNPMIISDDPEFNGAPPTVPNSTKQRIGMMLHNPDALVNLLKTQHIRLILVAKEQNYPEYDYLKRLPQVKKVQENSKLILYRIGG